MSLDVSLVYRHTELKPHTRDKVGRCVNRDEATKPEDRLYIALVDTHTEGGTFVVGGTDEADLNITYNYGSIYSRAHYALGIPWEGMLKMFDLYGTCGEMIPTLERLIHYLADTEDIFADESYRDYWAPTTGNAKQALVVLHKWCNLHPTAHFLVGG